MTGLGQVAAVWGAAVTLAIYDTASASGARLNPAVTGAFALFRRFPRGRILPYWLAQTAGAFLAAGVLYVFFRGALLEFEAAQGLVRGAAGSERSAMCYGEYFPNPALFDSKFSHPWVAEWQAMLAEGLGTALLVFGVFAFTDERNSTPHPRFAPVCIGITLAAVICIIAPLTQAGLNPARDFGPRCFAFLAGWGEVAIPGPSGGFFTVYILSPLLGAACGAAAWEQVVGPAQDGA